MLLTKTCSMYKSIIKIMQNQRMFAKEQVHRSNNFNNIGEKTKSNEFHYKYI